MLSGLHGRTSSLLMGLISTCEGHCDVVLLPTLGRQSAPGRRMGEESPSYFVSRGTIRESPPLSRPHLESRTFVVRQSRILWPCTEKWRRVRTRAAFSRNNGDKDNDSKIGRGQGRRFLERRLTRMAILRSSADKKRPPTFRKEVPRSALPGGTSAGVGRSWGLGYSSSKAPV